MTRFASLKPWAAMATVLTLATAGVAVQGRQQPPAAEGAREQGKDAAAVRALAREQLALIEAAQQTKNALARTGRVDFASPSFSIWERRKVETLRRSGAGKAEIIAALEQTLEVLKKQEAAIEAVRQSARATEIEVYDVKYRRMEAEIQLNVEKAR